MYYQTPRICGDEVGLVGRSVDASEQNDSNLPFCTGWNVVLLAGILRPVFLRDAGQGIAICAETSASVT